jgi:hypothetical protein
MRFTVIIFTVLFGILSFAPNMQGGQFFKLSELVDHYQEHQNSRNSFSSFVAFVKDHYFQNHSTREDERQLPFKSSVISTLVLVAQEVKVQPVSIPIVHIEDRENCFGEPHGAPQNQSFSIWNPPRMI